MGQDCCKEVKTSDSTPIVDRQEADTEDEDEDESDDVMDDEEFEKMAAKARGTGERQSISAEATNSNVDESTLPKYPKDPALVARIKGFLLDTRGSFIFESLSEKDLDRVILALKEVKKKKDDVVIEQDATVHETDDGLFVMERGTALVYKKDPNGETKYGKQVFEYTKPGSTFGELALLYNCPRAATVVCSSDCTLWALDRNSFSALVKGAMMKQRRDIDALLDKVEFLNSLSAHEKSKLNDVIKVRHFPAGEAVMTEGEPGNEMYIVQSGELEAVTKAAGVVMQYGEGQYFGELALLPGTGLRRASVRTKSQSSLLMIDRDSFKRLLGTAESLLAERAKKMYTLSEQK
jgi:cAMP-dependent protein kinase regulator